MAIRGAIDKIRENWGWHRKSPQWTPTLEDRHHCFPKHHTDDMCGLYSRIKVRTCSLEYLSKHVTDVFALFVLLCVCMHTGVWLMNSL